MKIIRQASAGTMESSDAYVEIQRSDKLNIKMESVVAKVISRTGNLQNKIHSVIK